MISFIYMSFVFDWCHALIGQIDGSLRTASKTEYLLRKTAFKLEGKASEDIWLWYSGRSLMVEFHVGQNYSWSPTMLNGAPVAVAADSSAGTMGIQTSGCLLLCSQCPAL